MLISPFTFLLFLFLYATDLSNPPFLNQSPFCLWRTHVIHLWQVYFMYITDLSSPSCCQSTFCTLHGFIRSTFLQIHCLHVEDLILPPVHQTSISLHGFIRSTPPLPISLRFILEQPGRGDGARRQVSACCTPCLASISCSCCGCIWRLSDRSKTVISALLNTESNISNEYLQSLCSNILESLFWCSAVKSNHLTVPSA